MSHRQHAPDSLRVDLAHTLGFPDYPGDASAEPYLNYITNRFVGRGTPEEYLRLVIDIIQYVRDDSKNAAPVAKSIQGLLNSLIGVSNEYFSDTKAGSQTRRDDVEDTVMYILGTWTLLLSSFIHLPVAGGARKIVLAYGIRAQENLPTCCHPYEESVSGLIQGSGLLPTAGHWDLAPSGDGNGARLKAAAQLLILLKASQHPSGSSAGSDISLHEVDTPGRPQTHLSTRFLDDLDSLESLHVSATRLNAYTLGVFGAVEIAWTHNVSRHMLLSKRGGRHVLELFALPCSLSATTLISDCVGITAEYAQEIRESYSILFNAWSDSPQHAKLWTMIGIKRFCWCWECSAARFRHQTISCHRRLSEKRTPGARRSRTAHASEFDPLLVELMQNEPSDWTPELFPSLWPRIMSLENHLQAAKPWNIWILFRDRRDTLQFWTFL
jgi:hypothetical protein